MTPTVSVVMPAHNAAAFIDDAIISIRDQYLRDFELIIVDDGSTDTTRKKARAWSDYDSRIQVLALDKKSGQPIARNHGIEYASSDLIATMDADDVAYLERLQQQVAFMRRHPEIGVLGSHAAAIDRGYNLLPFIQFRPPSEHALIVLNIFVGAFLIHPTTMIRADLLHAVNGYNDEFDSATDTELWTRLLWHTRFANLPEKLIKYRQHPLQAHKNRTTAQHAQSHEIRQRLLKRLLPEASPDTIYRFAKIQRDLPLGFRERRAARRDLIGVANGLVENGAISPDDRPIMSAHIDRVIESTTPRLWQKFQHWRRHRAN